MIMKFILFKFVLALYQTHISPYAFQGCITVHPWNSRCSLAKFIIHIIHSWCKIWYLLQIRKYHSFYKKKLMDINSYRNSCERVGIELLMELHQSDSLNHSAVDAHTMNVHKQDKYNTRYFLIFINDCLILQFINKRKESILAEGQSVITEIYYSKLDFLIDNK